MSNYLKVKLYDLRGELIKHMYLKHVYSEMWMTMPLPLDQTSGLLSTCHCAYGVCCQYMVLQVAT